MKLGRCFKTSNKGSMPLPLLVTITCETGSLCMAAPVLACLGLRPPVQKEEASSCAPWWKSRCFQLIGCIYFHFHIYCVNKWWTQRSYLQLGMVCWLFLDHPFPGGMGRCSYWVYMSCLLQHDSTWSRIYRFMGYAGAQGTSWYYVTDPFSFSAVRLCTCCHHSPHIYLK